jgi:molybdopterin-containing oxidoreductase family iron-sulfur binding subunit
MVPIVAKPSMGDGSFWKSLREFHDDPAVAEEKANEFKSGVTDDFHLSNLSGISRRRFLALLTASASFAAASCSSYQDKGEVIPYNKEPIGEIPGVANYYASTCTGCKNVCGILVKTREGRPIKINGNDEHPANKGKICARGQASILDLYDPERLREPQERNGNHFSAVSWASANGEIVKALNSAAVDDKEIAIISRTVLSPTTREVFEEFKRKYPTTKFYSYELFTDVNRNSAWQKCCGVGSYPLINWNKAKLILALEADFLGNEGNTPEQTRMFAETRNASDAGNISRLVVAESGMSITGMNADLRLKLKPEEQFNFVMSLLNEFVVKRQISRYALDKKVVAVLQGYSLEKFTKTNEIDPTSLEGIVSYISRYRSSSIVYAGDRLPETVHVVVNFLNEVLGSTGLYRTDQSKVNQMPYASAAEWDTLISKMNSGGVGAVIHFDSNPVYHLPNDSGYQDALGKVPMVVTLARSVNESAAASLFVLPITHDLESWNDFKTRTGFYSLQQPVIKPLYQSRQKEALLLTWIAGSDRSYRDTLYHEYLKNRWKNEVYPTMNLAGDFNTFWYSGLHDGIVVQNEKLAPRDSFSVDTFVSLVPPQASAGYSVVLSESYVLGDGEFANNGWLQELPHPVTKVVWDNYAAVGPETAQKLGVDYNDLLEIRVGDRKQKLPVFVQPGMAKDVIAVELGYGRWSAGAVGGNVGVNANVLLGKDGSLSQWIYPGGVATKVDGEYNLVSTMEHNFIDDVLTRNMQFSRGIIREGTVSEYESDPAFIQKQRAADRPTSIYKKFEYDGLKWAMAIDLNKCTGCSACVISCNAENNIPVVGKDQVAVSREMQWIRIDRYYSGSPVEPKISFQPMLCQHCDDAPCENVCPVAATTHSPDGLNMMVYNRCVGTRYCSNNCPYKVRRFNFFNFRSRYEGGYYELQPAPMVNNPEVTVRTRGVMEKCTFCVQRIEEAKQDALQSGRQLKGSDVITACQEACPANAIVFGDANDKDSDLAKMREHPLGYYALERLDIKPNVTYLAKLRNI